MRSEEGAVKRERCAVIGEEGAVSGERRTVGDVSSESADCKIIVRVRALAVLEFHRLHQVV